MLLGLLVVVAPAGCCKSGNQDPSGHPAPDRTAAQGPTRTITIPAPPLKPYGQIPAASSAAPPAPGDKPLKKCGPDMLSWPENRTGGPYPSASCYIPTAAGQCLASTDVALPRTLQDRGAVCVYDGPHVQSDPASGAPWCCYNLGYMGIGRPLAVANEARMAGVRAGGRWG